MFPTAQFATVALSFLAMVALAWAFWRVISQAIGTVVLVAGTAER
jgi:hypothetical protein